MNQDPSVYFRLSRTVKWLTIVATGVCISPARSVADTATGQQWMIATVHSAATAAASDVFREGGNAVDAAVAAALTLGVVDGHNSGIGGGCLILIRQPDGRLTAIDGREMAPAAARRDMFLRDGVPIPGASQTGPLAVGVPGALAAYELALARCGTRQLDRLLAPGLDAAENGFVIDQRYAQSLRSTADDLRRFDGSRAMLLRPDGTPPHAGERLVLPDLANTYRQISEHGTGWFYRGPFADRVGDWMAAHGGMLTAADFAAYRAKLREPIKSTYRGYQVIGFPPPSSGGVHVAQVLCILEHFDLKQIDDDDPVAATHVIAEAFKLAFADRAYWLGDADFVDVPLGLLGKDYAASLAKKIHPERATDVPQHGTPPNWRQDLFGRHTTHVAAADAQGNWVAITATVNTSFGSKVVVPGTGVVLNNEMDDFSIAPGVPNAFKLIGAENNAIAPGKRPLSSMSPTIVLDQEGRPLLTLGAAGGPKIISQVVLAIVRTIDFGQPLPDAVVGARFHHQWRPDVLYHEADLAPAVARGLQARGHALEVLSAGGVTQAVAARGDGGFIGVSDPRVSGDAAGE